MLWLGWNQNLEPCSCRFGRIAGSDCKSLQGIARHKGRAALNFRIVSAVLCILFVSASDRLPELRAMVGLSLDSKPRLGGDWQGQVCCDAAPRVDKSL